MGGTQEGGVSSDLLAVEARGRQSSRRRRGRDVDQRGRHFYFPPGFTGWSLVWQKQFISHRKLIHAFERAAFENPAVCRLEGRVKSASDI